MHASRPWSTSTRMVLSSSAMKNDAVPKATLMSRDLRMQPHSSLQVRQNRRGDYRWLIACSSSGRYSATAPNRSETVPSSSNMEMVTAGTP